MDEYYGYQFAGLLQSLVVIHRMETAWALSEFYTSLLQTMHKYKRKKSIHFKPQYIEYLK